MYFCYFAETYSSVSIKSGINHLFKFYGDIDHIDYVSTLKNIQAGKLHYYFRVYN